MGYRCPVCESPHPDSEHLANHVAFTGLMGGEDHESWLDEHVPDWADRDPESLGDALAEIVSTVDLEGVGSDDNGQLGRPNVDTVSPDSGPDDEFDPVTEAALAEARAMTEEMVGQSGETDGSSDTEEADRTEGEDR